MKPSASKITAAHKKGWVHGSMGMPCLPSKVPGFAACVAAYVAGWTKGWGAKVMYDAGLAKGAA